MARELIRRIAAVLFFATTAAYAEHDPFIRSFDAVPQKATAAQQSGIGLEGAQAPTARSYRLAWLFDLNVGVLSLKDGRRHLGDLIPYRLDGHLMFAIQLHERLELAADLPVTLLQGDNFKLLEDEGFPEPGVARVALGDLRVAPRVFLLRPDQFLFGVAAVAEVRLPSGDGTSFTGERGILFAPRIALDRPMGFFRLLGNVGYRFRQHGQFLNLYVGNEFTMGAGAIFRVRDLGPFLNVDALAETHLATPANAPFTFSQADSLKTPWELWGGLRGQFYKAWSAQVILGRGIGLTSGYGRETFRMMLGVSYDFAFKDRDNDGIPDDVDQCPDVPEDRDGFEDSNGCPDPDNDKDGIPDTEDACPDKAGPKEYDGCPDTDGDEIPDNVDKCPEEAGPAENEGCPFEGPAVELEADRIRVRGNIRFETGQATIQTQSYPLLDEVYAVLNNNPQVGPVVIEGHTDNVGSRPYNLDLSNRRAKAVVDYLVQKGIKASRLRFRGYGFDRPVATNATPLGRAKNRRVDFRLLEQGESFSGSTPDTAPQPPPDKAAPEAEKAKPETPKTPPTAPKEPLKTP